MSDQLQSKLSKSTLVPLGAAVAIALSLLWFGVSVGQTMSNQSNAIGNLTEAVSNLDTAIGTMNSTGWTKQDMELWVRLFKLSSPDIAIPEVEK
tara:strand:- start:19741 stop:20022 length:282 start_codon:yes stop_codon:yes gene_type:complete